MIDKGKSEEYLYTKKLIEEGKHEEAIRLIDTFMEKGEQTSYEILLYNFLKCKILYQQGLFEDLFTLAQHTYKESLGLGYTLLSIDASLRMAEALIWLHEPTKAERLIKQGKDLLKIQTQRHSLEYKIREANIFYIKGLFYAWNKNDADQARENLDKSIKLFESLEEKAGLTKSLIISAIVFGTLKSEHDHAIKLLEQSLALSEESNYQHSNAHSLILLGVNYEFKGDLDRSINLYEQSLTKSKELNNKYFLSSVFTYIGTAYIEKYDLGKALEYAKQGLALAKEVNHKMRIAESIGVVAMAYSIKGEIDQSITLYEQALKFCKEIDYKFGIAVAFNNLSGCYRIIGDLERALECIESSIAINNELGNLYNVTHNYDNLIEILIDKGELEQAQTSLEQLKHMKNQINDNFTNLLYLYDKALLLKTSSQIDDRGKSEEILKQILADENVNYELTVKVLLNLCELLHTELGITNDLSVLDEINSYTAQLLDFAEKSNSFILLAEVYFLKAKLALLTLDIKTTRRFLTQAQQIAERFTLNQLAAKIALEHKNLLEKRSMWENLKKKDISLTERIKLAGLNTQMKQILRESTILSTQTTKEEIKILKERKKCLVCKGEVLGYSFICQCDAVYCQKCAQALIDLENVCWVCNNPLDISKPSKPYKEEKGKKKERIKKSLKSKSK